MGSLNEPASEPAKAAARRANSFFSSSSSEREKSSLEIKKEKNVGKSYTVHWEVKDGMRMRNWRTLSGY